MFSIMTSRFPVPPTRLRENEIPLERRAGAIRSSLLPRAPGVRGQSRLLRVDSGAIKINSWSNSLIVPVHVPRFVVKKSARG